MAFWHVENLTKQTLRTGVAPWDFKATEDLTPAIRNDKNARQKWYQTPGTAHYFYTPLEPANPNIRPSKDNPPRAIHAFVADYDIRISPDRVKEAIAAMKLKPSWTERSLGGNVRLVWLLPRPLMTETYEFTCFILEEAIKWLNLGLLPALDEGAFTTPTRLLCNGCEWESTGHPALPEAEAQAFFVSCGKKFRFKGADGSNIPLDVIEAELKKRYPSFRWPTDFTADSQGPTFWIPESTSPLSAILKPEGFITFSAHAIKPFYSWSDVLGAEFVKQFAIESISKATTDIWWDGKRFWRKKGAYYVSLEGAELNNYFRVTCKLSPKPDSSGVSTVDSALNHIWSENHVVGAAPFVFQETGLLTYQGKRVLNTYVNRPTLPAASVTDWGVEFPFLASLLDNIFDPAEQKVHFLAWWKHAYTCALEKRPLPGQNVFFMGGANIGKTFLNRGPVAESLGSFVDASDFLVRGATFNSELFESPLWCVDDECAGDSESSRQQFQNMLKKVTANQSFRFNKKFEVSSMLEWCGRVIITTNLDFVSSRMLGSMDNTSSDKTSLFKCAPRSKIQFPERADLVRIYRSELPFLLRWLLNWNPPSQCVPDVRFGYESYHEPSLLDQAHQGGKSASFQEILIDSLNEFFVSHPDQKEWRGSVTSLLRLLYFNPANEVIMRTMRMEQVSRYIENIQRGGTLKCSAETGDQKIRVWIFPRPEK